MKELLDAEEYLVPQPGFFENQANGLTRHHSHRVRPVPLFSHVQHPLESNFQSGVDIEICRPPTWTGLRSEVVAYLSHFSFLILCFFFFNKSEHRFGTGDGRHAEWAEHALVGQHTGAESIPDNPRRSHRQRKLGRLSVPLAGPKPIALLRWWPIRLCVSGRGQRRASLQSWTLQ